jgi:hypothetical protein
MIELGKLQDNKESNEHLLAYQCTMEMPNRLNRHG